MIRIHNINLIEQQPEFLRNDPSTLAICHAIEPMLALMHRAMDTQLIYTNIDGLDGESLDKIARGFRCSWYNPNDTMSARISTIKTALPTFGKLGTVAAVQEVVSINFGNATVQEWFEYGGEPGTFRVLVEDPSATHERAARFYQSLEAVKSAGSTLEKVVLKTYSQLRIGLAAGSIVTRRYRSIETSKAIGGISPLNIGFAMTAHITRKYRSIEALETVGGISPFNVGTAIATHITRRMRSKENG